MKIIAYAAMVTAAVIWGGGARGQGGGGLLDQQLGDKSDQTKIQGTGEKKADAPGAADKPATDTARPAGGDAEPINPDAIKKVDDQELINSLIKPGNDKPNPQDVAVQFKSMLDRMGQSQKRLVEKDPGDVTQETQRRIVTDLDVMIELARRQQQSGSGSSQQPQDGQQRQQQDQQQNGQGQGGNQANRTENLPRGGSADAQVGGDMRNRDAASWGGLPPRDRDQVSHGAGEEYLPSYRDLINRYYQALAELGKSRNR